MKTPQMAFAWVGREGMSPERERQAACMFYHHDDDATHTGPRQAVPHPNWGASPILYFLSDTSTPLNERDRRTEVPERDENG